MARNSHVPTKRNKVEVFKMLQFEGGGAAFPATAKCLIQNPSSRLLCTIQGFLELPAGGGALFGYDQLVNFGATWRIRARTAGTGVNGMPPLHDVIGAADPIALQTLPNAHSLATGLRWLEVTLTQTALPNDGGVGIITAGNWFLQAIWEPVSSAEVDDYELEELFDKCQIHGTLTKNIP